MYRRHGPKKLAFDVLESEDGQLGRDNYGARKEYRTLYFMNGLAD